MNTYTITNKTTPLLVLLIAALCFACSSEGAGSPDPAVGGMGGATGGSGGSIGMGGEAPGGAPASGGAEVGMGGSASGGSDAGTGGSKPTEPSGAGKTCYAPLDVEGMGGGDLLECTACGDFYRFDLVQGPGTVTSYGRAQDCMSLDGETTGSCWRQLTPSARMPIDCADAQIPEELFRGW